VVGTRLDGDYATTKVYRFMDRIAPWVHYVPVHIDLSDLHDTLVFFRGGLHGEGAHEEMARKIATAGREWSKKFWRKEDLTVYMFRYYSLFFLESSCPYQRIQGYSSSTHVSLVSTAMQ